MGRKFIEGKGWEITEDELPPNVPAAKTGAGSAKVQKPGKPAPLTFEQLVAEAGMHGMMLVDQADYEATMLRIGELEHALDQATAPGPVTPAAAVHEKPGKKGKGKAAPVTIEAIAGAADLEALTILMAEVTDAELLAAAEQRAEEIKAGGA